MREEVAAVAVVTASLLVGEGLHLRRRQRHSRHDTLSLLERVARDAAAGLPVPVETVRAGAP